MSIFYVLDGIADSVSAVGEGILSLISRPRRLVALAFVLGVLAAASVVLETTIRKLLQSSAAPDPKVVLASLGAVVTALASMRLMLRYLRTDSEPREEPRSIRDRMTIETILRRISKVEEQAAGLSTETRDHAISETEVCTLRKELKIRELECCASQKTCLSTQALHRKADSLGRVFAAATALVPTTRILLSPTRSLSKPKVDSRSGGAMPDQRV